MLRAKRGQPRRKTMKTMLLAAAAALSLGIGSAYADSEGGQIANTQFTEIPGFLAQAPAQNAPAVATAQNERAVQTYATQSSHGTWLFPPHAEGGNG
jgi:predicted amidohydrolase YtcJ